MYCGYDGRNRDRAGKKDCAGRKARQKGMGLGRDVVRMKLRPTKAGKTAGKNLCYLSMYLELFSESTWKCVQLTEKKLFNVLSNADLFLLVSPLKKNKKTS